MKYKSLPQTSIKAFFAFFIAHIIWAAASPIIKLTLNDLPPFTFLLLRFGIVCVILLPFVFVALKRNPIDKRDWFNFLILGLLGQGSLAFLFLGINYTSALDAVILGVAGPLIGIMAGHHFFNERVGKEVKIGVTVASIGTLFVVLEPLLTGNHDTSGYDPKLRIIGNILVVINHLLFTGYILWSKMVMGEKSIKLREELKHLKIRQMHKKYDPNLVTMITFYTALLYFIPFAFAEDFGLFGMRAADFSNISSNGILGLLYMAILSSIVAYLLFQWGLNLSTVGESSIWAYLSPILTIPFAYWLLGELPSQITVLGCIIIGVGVSIAEWHKKLT